MYKELDITISLPPKEKTYHISICVAGYDEGLDGRSFELRMVSWNTYCEQLNDDIKHYVYDVWMKADDILELLEEVEELVESSS